jgi:glycosyltransferase involved in cell wall biosynthesis
VRILINGLPYFSKRIAQNLSDYSNRHSFRFLDTYNSKWAKLEFALRIGQSDGMISMNGVSDPSGSLDLAMKKHRKIWMQWQGTDVLLALNRAKNGTIYRKYIDHARHFCDAPWLIDELKSIGIHAELMHYKWLLQPEIKNQFQQLAVYSYVAKGKEDFYGWQSIKQFAFNHPEIPFYIVGSDGIDLLDIPPNVEFRGWVNHSEMQVLQSQTPIFIRLTEHDGFSLSVLEALAFGSEVIWNQPHPLVNLCNDETTVAVFDRLIEKLKMNGFQRSHENIAYIHNNFDKNVVMSRLISKMEEVFG